MYPPPSPPLRTPGTVVALRVIAWIQVGFAVVGLLGAVLLALLATPGLDSEDDLTRSFAQFGVVAAVVLLVVGVLVVAVIAVPTFLLRTGRRSRKTGALVTLAVVEALFAVLQLGGTVVAFTSDRPLDGVFPLVLSAVPVLVVVLALHPSSRAWAAGPAAPAPGYGPPAPVYPGPPAPPPTW